MKNLLKSFYVSLVVVGLISLSSLFAKDIFAQTCTYAPNGDIEGYECFSYTVPWQVEIGDIDSGPGINTPVCKDENQEARGIPELRIGDSYRICCPVIQVDGEEIHKQCSEYMVRTAICGNAEEAVIKCDYSSDRKHLSCWGNNYRRCDTTSPDFPAPDEGNSKRSGYLIGDGTFTEDPALAKTYNNALIKYNGQDYPVNNMKIWFCDANVINCGPSRGEQGEGESRLWFPHLRLIATLSTIAQSMFNPHPSSLINNAPPSNPDPVIDNPGILTTRIEKHQGQGLDDDTNVVNTTDNNSSLIIGQQAPDPLYSFGGGNVYEENAQCVIPDTIENPGDDLLGPQITGRVLYTQKYEYEACPRPSGCMPDGSTTTDPATCCSQITPRDDCKAEPQAIGANLFICGSPPKKLLPTKGKVSIFAKNPIVEYIYDVLIEGDSSLFKRFMPSSKIAEGIDEIPSAVGYQASATSNNHEGASTQLKIGEGQASSPTFYVPHVGSLKKYWLEDFQTALRPKDITASSELAPPPGGSVGQSQCSYAESEVDTAIGNAASKYNVPESLLRAVFEIEGLDYIDNPENYTCQENFAHAAGVMQITKGTYDIVTCEEERIANDLAMCTNNDDEKLSRCDVDDAFELGARVLLLKAGKWVYGPGNCRATGGIREVDVQTIYKATCDYYGTFSPDDLTRQYGYNLPNPKRSDPPGMNYCDIVCNKMGNCPPYPPQEDPFE